MHFSSPDFVPARLSDCSGGVTFLGPILPRARVTLSEGLIGPDTFDFDAYTDAEGFALGSRERLGVYVT